MESGSQPQQSIQQKEYAYTTYSATQSYTSQLNIRPREVMVTAGYQF